jgi:hypothetical protein
MPAHSRSNNGVASLAYVAGIHVLKALQHQMAAPARQVMIGAGDRTYCSIKL